MRFLNYNCHYLSPKLPLSSFLLHNCLFCCLLISISVFLFTGETFAGPLSLFLQCQNINQICFVQMWRFFPSEIIVESVIIKSRTKHSWWNSCLSIKSTTPLFSSSSTLHVINSRWIFPVFFCQFPLFQTCKTNRTHIINHIQVVEIEKHSQKSVMAFRVSEKAFRSTNWASNLYQQTHSQGVESDWPFVPLLKVSIFFGRKKFVCKLTFHTIPETFKQIQVQGFSNL